MDIGNILKEIIAKFGLSEIAFFLGLIGTSLGIINTWRSFRKDSVRFKVKPAISYPVSNTVHTKVPYVSIEVLNLSNFSITISEVGFLFTNSKERCVIARPILIDGGVYPRRLDSRTAFTVYAPLQNLDITRIDYMKYAYAKTDCGVIKKAKSAGVIKSAYMRLLAEHEKN